MPSTFKLSTLLENSFAASGTRSAITHTVPQVISSISNYWSVAAEFTGSGSNVITTVAGPPITITVGGTPQIDPITRQTISVLKVHGYIVYVGRAVAATAPTNNVNLTAAGIASTAITSTVLPEGSLFSVHVPIALDAVAAQTLTVNLSSTTGYKVSVVVYGSSPAV
jgi:hypothetical protein